jgi:hypothetical protein
MSEHGDVLFLQLHGKEITIVLVALRLLADNALACFERGITDVDLALFTDKLEEVFEAQGWLS